MKPADILVIEDNHQLAESMEDMLRISGHNPHITLTGREGLSYAIEHHPDLIILDIRLPDISGYDVYHKLRKDEWGKDAKVMILTASESVENISKNVNLPKEHVLFKPESSVKYLLQRITERLAD